MFISCIIANLYLLVYLVNFDFNTNMFIISFSDMLEDRSQILESLSTQQKKIDELSHDLKSQNATVGTLSVKLKVSNFIILGYIKLKDVLS